MMRRDLVKLFVGRWSANERYLWYVMLVGVGESVEAIRRLRSRFSWKI